MNHQKGISSIVIILIIIGVLVIAGGVWYWQSQKEKIEGIVEWQTYRNDIYGVEFQYPSNFKLIGAGPAYSSEEYGDINYNVSFSDNITIINVTLNEVISQDPLKSCRPNANEYFKTVEFGPDKTKITVCRGLQGNNVIFLETVLPAGTTPYYHEISISSADMQTEEKDLKIFDHLVATFKISSSGKVIKGAASWKTYRNEKYGFEIKYPSTLKVFELGEEERKICLSQNQDCLGYIGSEDWRVFNTGQLVMFIKKENFDPNNVIGVYGKISKEKLEPIIVDGKESYIFSQADAGCIAKIVNIPINNLTLNLSFSDCEVPDEQEEHYISIYNYRNQILSTFKFTK